MNTRTDFLCDFAYMLNTTKAELTTWEMCYRHSLEKEFLGLLTVNLSNVKFG